MGSSQSSSSGANVVANWQDEEATNLCTCTDRQHGSCFSENIGHIRVKFNQFIGTPFHHAVTVRFRCRACRKAFYRTYELSSSGKSVRNGKYGRIRDTKGFAVRRIPYSTIEDIFESMSSYYHLREYNCGHWARTFWDRLMSVGSLP